MSPLELLLYTLAATPAVIVVGLTVNLVANNIAETRATAQQWPLPRTVKLPKARTGRGVR